MNELLTLAEANGLIASGRSLLVAGDEKVLRQLHQGNWIGGTTPYFITRDGGIVERERVLVSELPDAVIETETHLVDIGHIPAITTDAPRYGFSIVIVPGLSDIHTAYGLTANAIPGIHDTPIAGWVAGVHLSEIGEATPKVFDGITGACSDRHVAVMRAKLPSSKTADIGMINLFHPGDGDEIVFHEPAFSARDCSINGETENFYDYVLRKKLDLKLPLVTELSGHHINVSFQAIEGDTRTVKFYAPVMKGRVYRQAAPIADYREALVRAVQGVSLSPVFACNCILNYLYGHLEGERHIPVPGPVTFGELAHVLINQTLVYLTISDK